jgi:CheY-like chemotaxis protein
MKCPLVLCVDDAEEILSFYEDLLGKYGYAVMLAEDGAEALEVFQRGSPQIDAVILDYQMPGMTGLELAFSVKGFDPYLPVVMVSGNGPRLEEMLPFVDAAIPKGSSIREITDQLELLLEERASRMLLAS